MDVETEDQEGPVLDAGWRGGRDGQTGDGFRDEQAAFWGQTEEENLLERAQGSGCPGRFVEHFWMCDISTNRKKLTRVNL